VTHVACNVTVVKFASIACDVDAYTTEDLVFHWRTDAKSVEMNDNISLPEYTITNVSHMVCSKNFSSTG